MLVTEALQVARRCGACGPVILRADSAFYTRAVVLAPHRPEPDSVSPPLYPSVTRAVAAIADTPIRYPQAIFDEAEQRWISDAEAAEVSFAAFRARPAPPRPDRAAGALAPFGTPKPPPALSGAN